MSDEAKDLNRQIAEELQFKRVTVEGMALYPMHLWQDGQSTTWNELLDWAHSVDAALTLPIGDEAHWLMHNRSSAKYWEVQITDVRLSGKYYFDADADTLAEAICRAWLAYRKAKGEK